MTDQGIRIATLYNAAHDRVLRPALAEFSVPLHPGKLGHAVRLLQEALAAA